jgi:hypothetical protein
LSFLHKLYKRNFALFKLLKKLKEKKTKMHILANTIKPSNLKGKTFAIALILVLTFSSALVLMPAIKAQEVSTPGVQVPLNNGYVIFDPSASQVAAADVPKVATYPLITASPTPIGVNQNMYVIMFMTLLPASWGVEATTATYGGWGLYTLTITKPDGTNQTMGPFESDPSGMYQVNYVPTTVGKYSFQYSFSGELVAHALWGGISGTSPQYYNAYFEPSTSISVSVTVQQAPLSGYTEAPVPLPTQYWTTPINAQNRAWNVISGPWLLSTYNATGPFNPYTYAPNSAHILWTDQLNPESGGIIGGDYGSLEYARSTGFSTPIVMNGYVYYNGPASPTAGSEFYCMQLSTGKIIWSAPRFYKLEPNTPLAVYAVKNRDSLLMGH